VQPKMTVESLSAACSNKLNTLEHLLSRSFHGKDVDRKNSTIEDATRLKAEAEALIIQLEGELHNIGSVVNRNKLAANIGKLHKTFNKLDEELDKRKQEVGRIFDRQELFYGTSATGASGAARPSSSGWDRKDYEEHLLQDTQARSKRMEENLVQSRSILQETLEIGDGVMDNLEDQRETLLDAAERVEDTDNLVGQSRKILKRMAKRTCRNKFFLYLIILILILLNILVLYYMYIKH